MQHGWRNVAAPCIACDALVYATMCSLLQHRMTIMTIKTRTTLLQRTETLHCPPCAGGVRSHDRSPPRFESRDIRG